MPSYSFKDVLISLADGDGKVYPLSDSNLGIADEGITVEPAEPRNNQLRGTSGEVLNMLSATRAGVVKLHLLKTSTGNRTLTNLFNDQAGNPAKWGKNLISIRDKHRGDSMLCGEVAFTQEPAHVWAKNGNVVEWTFAAGRIHGFD